MGYDKVQQGINNIVEDNVKKIAQLFPSVVKDGEVDFEALKEELGQFSEAGSEKYELTWSGKKNAKKVAQEDIVGKTLKYIPDDSKDADTTENLYIEGDNLEVLKLLRQNYYNSIKMIYIDPPYNTGNDFVYNDNFTMSEKESTIAEGDANSLGERYTVNGKSQNRYHANWLNMIYPRLKVAKDLLSDDGVILISIDDNEVDNVTKMGKEIFGDTNYIASLIWKSRQNKDNRNLSGISIDHEYVIVFAKDSTYRSFIGGERNTDAYKNPDNDPRGLWTSANMAGLLPEDQRPNCHYDLIHPQTGVNYGKPKMGWRYDKNTMNRLIEEDRIIWPPTPEGRPRRKVFLNEITETLPGYSSIIGNEIYTRNGTAEIDELMGNRYFDFPKPSDLLVDLIKQATDKNSLVLDFFSGSGTFGNAVMKVNLEDKGRRRFILAQLPEKLLESSQAAKEGYKTICDIAKKRLALAGEKIKSLNSNIDVGFKVFKTENSNIKWNSLIDLGQLDVTQIEYSPDLIDFISGAKDIDIVYEMILRQRNVALSAQLQALTDIGERTYLYANSFLVCLETSITEELINEVASLDPLPLKFIFRDSSFKDDIALKDETFRRLNALIKKTHFIKESEYTVEFI
nr:site-specific DNA-methyltransferase [uncultured Anaerosporobacter sp.]